MNKLLDQLENRPGCDPTPEEIGHRIIKPLEDLKSIVRNGYGMELDDVSKKHLDEVLKRTIVKNVPFYKQQYVFRLIKMH
jgi:hypothetical protein